ncbi:MAG: carbohydrate kinase family protein [Gammaproteobacteria bacterium]|nr:carbohydrate kinase family protein [Gammaproteobacteria bacterium]NND53408.1 carbohydrate kinase family protein [Gammaproteobacteria bacterium]
MSALICGSMAYDNIMVFPGHFKEQIMPDQIHILNVAFLVPEMRKEFGGCAGNIAYNLNMLGGAGYAMATVGEDFGNYRSWLQQAKVDSRYISEVPDTFTAQAYITTDLDDNQITAFHPGAMDHSHSNRVPTDAGITLGMISPDGRQGMIEHAEQFAAAEIPFVFDPGQGLPMFDGDDLRAFIGQAAWVTVNDYEGQMLQERTGWSAEEIASRVQALIVTRGGEGSRVYADGDVLEIPAVAPAEILDPTGCGDSYRAGLLYGLLNDLNWHDTGRLAALIGSIKIAHRGTQNHQFTPASLDDQFEAAFGYRLGL